MKKCWDSNPVKRLNLTEIEELIELFYSTNGEISEQFKEAEKYRLNNNNGVNQSNKSTTHHQAIYTSRLLNPFTKDLPKYADNTECLDCEITIKSELNINESND